MSDGRVFANAAEVKLLNIGDMVVNSELVIDYDQFVNMSEISDFILTGTGVVTVLVDSYAQAEEFFNDIARNPFLLSEDVPEIRLENSSLGVVTKIDLANLVQSKLVFFSASIDKQINNLEAQHQAQREGNDLGIARDFLEMLRAETRELLDDSRVLIDDGRFTAFEWGDATITVVPEGNADADIVRSFQTEHKVSELQGVLAESIIPEKVDIGIAGSESGMSLSDQGCELDFSANYIDADDSLTAEQSLAASSVAALLDEVYEFNITTGSDDAGGAALFAETATEDLNLTAIGVNNRNDEQGNTVEALELSMLAAIENLGEDASSVQNLAVELLESWQPSEIIHLAVS